MVALPTVAAWSMVIEVSPVSIRMRANGTSNSSATICDSAVRTPVPRSTLLVNTVTFPSESNRSQESSESARGSEFAPAAVCAKTCAAGHMVKLTASAPVPLSSCRREILEEILVSIAASLNLFRCGAPDGADHANVATAAAQDVTQELLDVGHAWLRVLVQQDLCMHDDAVHTEAALGRLFFNEGLLKGVGMLNTAQSLQRCNLFALRRRDRVRTRTHRSSIDDDRARAALPQTTSKARAI